MSKLGKKIIARLTDLNRIIETGEPIQQSVMRRIKVKGKTVYTRETFKAPIGKPK
jgi:hypothetical protein